MISEDSSSLAADIVAAYVSYNKITPEQVVDLLRAVRAELDSPSAAGGAPMAAARADTGSQPAVPVEQSIQPHALVCLECGTAVKLLRSHLRHRHNLWPHEYCERWGLDEDYPFVAHDLSSRRRSVALDTGLGKSDHPRHTERRARADGAA